MVYSIKLNYINIERKEIIIDGKSQLPLVNTYVTMDIQNVPVAYINAIRRVSLDELVGYALQVPINTDWSETDDVFMLPQFIIQRINLIPLKSMINIDVTNIKFDLIIKNNTVDVLPVYSSDLKLVSGKLLEPIFNSTFKICILQPNKQIVIKGIYISSDMGKNNIAYQRACCSMYKHLDIDEYDRKETHLMKGSQVDNSGYKISSMISNPQHHLFKCIIPATNNNPKEIISLFTDVCINIKKRLQFILSFIESADIKVQGIEYSVYQLIENGVYECVLTIINETYTIGELLKRTTFDLYPDIINVKYIILSHENSLKMVIQYKEHVTKILKNVILTCINQFESLQKQLINSQN